ncbi:pentapeptide repeat-containing protein [Streptomyces sp. ISL-1]|uniref:pentapeptide repeat-containing protein n=1 Tax=Streptomyces sp. ISL-1 TaxID=2817657 RepID=UPI001BE54C37|nr:pentapeptide repeat-containing protein [Streptomyces sp. ISL-1]MBT2393393.1 pentapeptide repeat-containing protein [Streptomyces sp. ISL-1]
MEQPPDRHLPLDGSEGYQHMAQTPEKSKGEDKKNTTIDWLTLGVAFVAAAASIGFGIATLFQEGEKEANGRYSDFVDKIGSTSPDVRMGGIYTLEELNKESEIDQRQMMEILTSFIRGQSPRPPKLVKSKKKASEYCYGLKAPKNDVATAMRVLARSEIQADESPDLSNAELTRLDLPEQAKLPNVDFTSTDLRCSSLRGVNLETADLSGTWLTWADLTDANLSHAKNLDQAFWRHTTCPDGTKSRKNEKDIETCIGHLATVKTQSPTPSGG